MKIKMAFGLTSETIVGNKIGIRLVLHKLLKKKSISVVVMLVHYHPETDGELNDVLGN